MAEEKVEESGGYLGGKYQSQEAFEQAYKHQDREVQRLQAELSKQQETIGNLQPIAEILNRPGGLDAVESYIRQGAPKAEPEVNPYEDLPDDIGDMDKSQFAAFMKSRESQLRSQFANQAKEMVNEAINQERNRGQAQDAERSFKERHGVSEEDFVRFKHFANNVSRVDLQDTLYQRYVESLGGPQGSQANTRVSETPQPNLPNGAGMGAGAPASSLTPDQEFLETRRRQLTQDQNEALAILKGPLRRS